MSCLSDGQNGQRWDFTCLERGHASLNHEIFCRSEREEDTLSLDSSTALEKKKIGLGGLAPTEWTHSARDVRLTLVVNCSTPSLNFTFCVAYRSPIVVSPDLLAVTNSYVKRTLWCCGLLCPYVSMDSLGIPMHLDCNAMGEVPKITPLIPSTGVQNAIFSLLIIHIIPSRQIYWAINNPSLGLSVPCHTSSSYLWTYERAADNVSHSEK